ncbi:beta-ketoacyl synthase, partial [Streptomyces sp. NPDC093991]
PATLIFDHPTPTALTHHIRSQVLVDDEPGATPTLAAELERLERLVGSATPEDVVSHRMTDRLRALLAALEGTAPTEGAADEDDLDAATDDELFDLLDGELGTT